MTRVAVLDASAAIRLFVGDGPIPDGLEQAVEAASSGDLVLVVPDLFWIETTHVLLRMERRGHLTVDECDALLAEMRLLPCRTEPHALQLAEIPHLVRAHGLSAYDAAYLALARLHGAKLWTADAQLAGVS